MKIGPIEIRWRGNLQSAICNLQSLSEAELFGAFRVSADDLFFRAVLQIVEEVEREQITEGRIFAGRGQATECVNATGGGAALELLRDRLERKRVEAVKGNDG